MAATGRSPTVRLASSVWAAAPPTVCAHTTRLASSVWAAAPPTGFHFSKTGTTPIFTHFPLYLPILAEMDPQSPKNDVFRVFDPLAHP